MLNRYIDRWNKPYYFFRPSRLIRRIFQMVRKTPPALFIEKLPWDLELEVNVEEGIGMAIWKTGTYDFPVSEVLWRLTEPGDTVVDVGANIGYMTSLLARRVGEKGNVYAFEPHPEVFHLLSKNIQRWKSDPSVGTIYSHVSAASNFEGSAKLHIPKDFALNCGLASLSMPAGGDVTAKIDVPVTRLDRILPKGTPIKLMKIDVEGHEREVCEGLGDLLTGGNISYILYEDLNPAVSRVREFLEKHGYQVFFIHAGWLRPILTEDLVPSRWVHGPPSYLAALDSKRVLEKLNSVGWKFLG